MYLIYIALFLSSYYTNTYSTLLIYNIFQTLIYKKNIINSALLLSNFIFGFLKTAYFLSIIAIYNIILYHEQIYLLLQNLYILIKDYQPIKNLKLIYDQFNNTKNQYITKNLYIIEYLKNINNIITEEIDKLGINFEIPNFNMNTNNDDLLNDIELQNKEIYDLMNNAESKFTDLMLSFSDLKGENFKQNIDQNNINELMMSLLKNDELINNNLVDKPLNRAQRRQNKKNSY